MHFLLLITSLFSSFLLVSSSIANCNYGDIEYDGYCYTFVNQRLLFPDAQTHCATLGGVLVRVRGDQDGRWLAAIAGTEFHATYGNFWIGLQLVDGQWEWEDASTSTYKNWAPGYPFSGYDYVGAQLSNAKWVTVRSSLMLPFICYYQKGHNRNQLTTPAPSQNPGGICTGAELLLEHRCYSFIPTLLPYAAAKQKCESIGKTLAIFDDQMQINFVTSVSVSKFSMNYGSFWVGLTKNTADNTFHWADGNVNSLKNWTPGYPFQHQTVVSQQVSNGKWKTSETDTLLPSVCSGYLQ
ncbi:C-type lectin domain-containing protein [Caenorhabditis elegans]|uniref:C-type lectin domain-containing protein n=1 Tax=Caenorhabditis elegans TaxID=6239 RepID=Q9XUA7_CAEEL|nr:C-type lectin domain-containing protein [Caenorhabditis elegans]CAB05321.1 C-type lectin domain-containing protein [Caenorhabditis elegans]|eukprot:NP_502451.1 C-type LECtin [Caenorhabditis elegans]